jgi:hypothetical protein
MNIQTLSNLAFVAIVAIAAPLCIPDAYSQGRGGGGGGAGRAAPPPSAANPISMTNPVGRMTNPVAPIIPSPFFPHPATTPPLNLPNYGRSGAPYVDHHRESYPSYIGPSYMAAPYYNAYPYYSYDYNYLGFTSTLVTIPGLPPGARYEDYRDTRYDSYQAATAYSEAESAAPAHETPYLYVPQPEPEPRFIVREPQPDRVIERPGVGTARADVLKKFGHPWGSIVSQGIETLFFDDITVVLGMDARVTSTR